MFPLRCRLLSFNRYRRSRGTHNPEEDTTWRIQERLGEGFVPSTDQILIRKPEIVQPRAKQEQIICTQFRSFDYLPLLAAQLVDGRPLPSSGTFDDIPEMPTGGRLRLGFRV